MVFFKNAYCAGIVAVPDYTVLDANGITGCTDHTLAIDVIDLELYLCPLVIEVW